MFRKFPLALIIPPAEGSYPRDTIAIHYIMKWTLKTRRDFLVK
jgi:hypothetical protein